MTEYRQGVHSGVRPALLCDKKCLYVVENALRKARSCVRRSARTAGGRSRERYGWQRLS